MKVYKVHMLAVRRNPDFSARATETAQAFVEQYNECISRRPDSADIFIPNMQVANEAVRLREQIQVAFGELCERSSVRPELITVHYVESTLGKYGRIGTAWFTSGSAEFNLTP